MNSFLIIGGTENLRLQKVLQFVNTNNKEIINHPDFFLLQSTEGSIGIDEIRKLKAHLSFKPYKAKNKIAIIVEAQNLTTEAQNALLKTLEEPYANTQIFLTAPDTDLLLPTVVSRCQIIHLPPNSTSSTLNNQNVIQILSAPTIGKKLKSADLMGINKDRNTAKNFLNHCLQFARINLNTQQPLNYKLNQTTLVSIIKLIMYYLDLLEANCNTFLVIDNFLIQLHHLTKN